MSTAPHASTPDARKFAGVGISFGTIETNDGTDVGAGRAIDSARNHVVSVCSRSAKELSLMRARHYARLLTPVELTGEGDDLGLTLEDLVPGLAASAREPRLLGYYSRQGLELALERHGFLDRMRGKGWAAYIASPAEAA